MLVAFGSRVTGAPPPGPQSDLDLAIMIRPRKNKIALETFFGPIGEIFSSYDVDLTILNGADPLFRFEVMRNCVLLFGYVDYFVAYQVFCHRDMMDSRALIELENRLFQKKMAYLQTQLAE